MIEKGFSPKRLSVILPAYNESEAIPATLEALVSAPALDGAEILVVDDGSSDGTASKVAGLNQVRLVSHTVNKGYGAALVTGARAASREYVCWFDADGQHRVEDLVKVARTLMTDDLDYCIGVRTADSYVVPSRRLGKSVLRATVRLAAGQSVKDFNSGLRGFRREILLRYLHLFPSGFGASTTMTLLMLQRNYKGGSVPIRVQARVGTSSVRQLRDGMRTLMLILRVFLLFKPLHFFGSVATLSFIIGIAYGTFTAVSKGLGFPVLAAVLIIFSAQAFFFGLVVDQISAMRRERFE